MAEQRPVLRAGLKALLSTARASPRGLPFARIGPVQYMYIIKPAEILLYARTTLHPPAN